MDKETKVAVEVPKVSKGFDSGELPTSGAKFELVNSKDILAQAPSIHDILARPFLYEQWLKKLQEAVNG